MRKSLENNGAHLFAFLDRNTRKVTAAAACPRSSHFGRQCLLLPVPPIHCCRRRCRGLSFVTSFADLTDEFKGKTRRQMTRRQMNVCCAREVSEITADGVICCDRVRNSFSLCHNSRGKAPHQNRRTISKASRGRKEKKTTVGNTPRDSPHEVKKARKCTMNVHEFTESDDNRHSSVSELTCLPCTESSSCLFAQTYVRVNKDVLC